MIGRIVIKKIIIKNIVMIEKDFDKKKFCL